MFKNMVIFIFLFLTLNSCSENAQGVTEMPSDFVELKEVNPNIVYDLRYYSKHNFVGDTIDGYEAKKCYMTRVSAKALSEVQKELEEIGFTIKVYDAYRPQRAVDHFVRWAKDIDDTRMRKEFYPDVDKKNLFKDGYIAAKSSHSRGSTVDLTIVPLPVPEQEQYKPGMELCECYKSREERFGDNSIDMGTGFDCFDEHSHPLNKSLSVQQRANRMLLRTLMTKHGFVPYEQEWWHFTFKEEPYPNTYFDFPIK